MPKSGEFFQCLRILLFVFLLFPAFAVTLFTQIVLERAEKRPHDQQQECLPLLEYNGARCHSAAAAAAQSTEKYRASGTQRRSLF